LTVGGVLALFAPGEQLTCTVQHLSLSLAYLDRLDRVISRDLLDRLAATDRLHGYSGLEFGTVVRRLIIGGSPDQGRYPASEVNDGACPEKPVHLSLRSLRT
jgi:hypothetical protein